MYSYDRRVKRLCFLGNEIMRISVTLPQNDEHTELCEFCAELADNALLWCEEEYKRLCESFAGNFARCDYSLCITVTEKDGDGAELFITAVYRKGGSGGARYEKRLFWSYKHKALYPK